MKKILITLLKNIFAAAVTAAVVGGVFVLIGLYDASEFQNDFFSIFLAVLVVHYWRLWDEKRKEKKDREC
jgi:membrane protein implicated in regulation of membrane protease activity